MKYLALFAVALLPSLSMAATYYYVDTSGEVQSVEAANAQTALMVAPNIAANSGVALDMGYLEEGMDVNAYGYSNNPSTGEMIMYHFVNIFGLTDSVEAPNPQTALQIAPNIAANSGVAIDQGDIENGEVVRSVAN